VQIQVQVRVCKCRCECVYASVRVLSFVCTGVVLTCFEVATIVFASSICSLPVVYVAFVLTSTYHAPYEMARRRTGNPPPFVLCTCSFTLF